jgi:hypothetical protein
MTVLWNTADKSANITLSGSSLIATASSAAQGGVRADTSFAGGLLYYEVKLNGTAGNLTGIGWCNAAAAFTSYIGIDTKGIGGFPQNTNTNIVINNASIGTVGRNGSTGEILRIAVNFTSSKIWFALPGSYWNNSATADPGSGTGGLSISTIAAGPYFPFFCVNASGFGVTANFGATPFQFPIPSGFSPVDTSTFTYEAVSKMIGYAIEAPPDSAISISKMIGYAIEAPPDSAISISKMLGYSITQDHPRAFSRARQYSYLRR